jgi:hypothetical protein
MNLLDRQTVFNHYHITLNPETAPANYPAGLANNLAGPSYEDVWCSNDADNIAKSIVEVLKKRYPDEDNVAYYSFISLLSQYFMRLGISYGTEMYEEFYDKELAAQKLLLGSLTKRPLTEVEDGVFLISTKAAETLWQTTLNAEETVKRINLLEDFYFGK